AGSGPEVFPRAPTVHNWRAARLLGAGRTRLVEAGAAGEHLLQRIVREAKVAVHMPLRELAADVGNVAESAAERKHVHRRRESLLSVAHLVDEGFGTVGVEDATVVHV